MIEIGHYQLSVRFSFIKHTSFSFSTLLSFISYHVCHTKVFSFPLVLQAKEQTHGWIFLHSKANGREKKLGSIFQTPTTYTAIDIVVDESHTP